MLATRLLMAGAGAGAFTPTALSWTLTSADEGGWTQANFPSVVEYSGLVYFGYVDMDGGNIEVRSFNPTTGTVSSAFVISAALEQDVHAAPSLYVRSDGRLMVVYCEHNATTIYRRVSTNVLPDISAFDAAGTVLTGTDLTYPTVVEYGGDVHVFFRDIVSSTSRLMQVVSTDDGATWGSATHLWSSAGRFSYWQVRSTGSRLDVVASDGRNPPDAGDVTIGHMYYDGSWRNSAGSAISGSTPYDPADMTTVYDSSDGMGWPQDLVAGANPVFTYAVLDTPTTNSWRRAHWNGSAWVNRTVASSAGAIDSGFAATVVLDYLDTDHVYASIYDGSYWQMHALSTADEGLTWHDRQMTSGSTDHIYPKPVVGSTGLVRAMWQSGGPYVSYLEGGFGITAGR